MTIKDCSGCSFFKEGLAYYFCYNGGKHIIDDIKPVCEYYNPIK